MPLHEREPQIKHALEREKHSIEAHHEQEHKSFQAAQKYAERSMLERQAEEDEELRQQHALEWELKLAKEKIAKLEMEKQHTEDKQRIDDKQHEFKAGLAMED